MADDIVERLRETIVAYDTWYQGQLKTSDTLLERFSRERKEAADEITRLRAENEKLRDAYDTDALTISYNLGYTCGKDIAKDEIEKLHREAAIRIDQIEREQEAHLRTISDYNRAMVKNDKLHKALKPFADAVTDEYSWKYDVNSDDFRAARKALGET